MSELSRLYRRPAATVTKQALSDVAKQGTRSHGSPLPGGVQSRMETAFGHDFSRVRVHSGNVAGGATRALSARAYTVGNDVVVGPGCGVPGSTDWERVLAHELTHVVQQEGAAGSADLASDVRLSDPDDAAEREADQSADLGVRTRIDCSPAPHNCVHRWPWDDGGSDSDVYDGDDGGGFLDALGGAASSAWDSTKEAASGAYSAYEEATDVKPAVSALDQGVDWAENQMAQVNQRSADNFKGIPVLEQIAQAQAYGATQSMNFGGGVIKGAGDLAAGVFNTAYHPIDTLGGLEAMVEHSGPGVGGLFKAAHGVYDLATDKKGAQYGDTWGDLANHLFNPKQYAEDDLSFGSDLARGILTPGAKDWDESWQRMKDNPGDTLGRAATNVAPIVLGLGEATAGRGAVRAAGAAESAGEAAAEGAAIPRSVPVEAPPPTLRSRYAPPGVPEPAPYTPEIPIVEPPPRPPGAINPGGEPVQINPRHPFYDNPYAPTEPVPGQAIPRARVYPRDPWVVDPEAPTEPVPGLAIPEEGTPGFDSGLGYDPAGPLGPYSKPVPVPSGGFDPGLGYDPFELPGGGWTPGGEAPPVPAGEPVWPFEPTPFSRPIGVGPTLDTPGPLSSPGFDPARPDFGYFVDGLQE